VRLPFFEYLAAFICLRENYPYPVENVNCIIKFIAFVCEKFLLKCNEWICIHVTRTETILSLSMVYFCFLIPHWSRLAFVVAGSASGILFDCIFEAISAVYRQLPDYDFISEFSQFSLACVGVDESSTGDMRARPATQATWEQTHPTILIKISTNFEVDKNRRECKRTRTKSWSSRQLPSRLSEGLF
jgi:hypothetical protein